MLFLRKKVIEKGPLKIQLSVSVQMVKPIDDTEVSFRANKKCKKFTTDITEDETFDFIDQMSNAIKIFSRCGSGFVVQKNNHLDIKIKKFKPIRGGI